jgi:hypothetical protein
MSLPNFAAGLPPEQEHRSGEVGHFDSFAQSASLDLKSLRNRDFNSFALSAQKRVGVKFSIKQIQEPGSLEILKSRADTSSVLPISKRNS